MSYVKPTQIREEVLESGNLFSGSWIPPPYHTLNSYLEFEPSGVELVWRRVERFDHRSNGQPRRFRLHSGTEWHNYKMSNHARQEGSGQEHISDVLLAHGARWWQESKFLITSISPSYSWPSKLQNSNCPTVNRIYLIIYIFERPSLQQTSQSNHNNNNNEFNACFIFIWRHRGQSCYSAEMKRCGICMEERSPLWVRRSKSEETLQYIWFRNRLLRNCVISSS